VASPRLYRTRRGPRGLAITIVLLTIVAAAGIWFDRAIYEPVHSIIGQTIAVPTPVPAVAPTTAPPNPTAAAGAASTTAASLQPSPSTPQPTATPLPTLSGTDRINILLLGSDTDTKFGGSYITQIMLVATIDPVHHTVGLLSVPRDFWVPIPGHGVGKIQIAYQFGNQDHPNWGGIALARQTIEDDFGIHIDHYAWIGLEGFIKVIDTAGGVDVDVLHPILDDTYPDDISNGKVTTTDIYAYRRLYIPAGPQHLDGNTALQYVRSRHADLIGDFGRSQRQQEVLLKLRRKVEQPGTILRIPQYLDDLQSFVKSDFSVTELPAYGNFLRQYGNQSVTQVVLMPPQYSSLGVSGDGQDIVIPNWPAVHDLVARMFAPPLANGSPALVDPGSARIAVENGTTIGGLGARAVIYLNTLGYTVGPARDAVGTGYATTVVTVYNPDKQALAGMLAQAFGAEVRNARGGTPPGADDIVVTLGQAHGTFEGF